MNNKKVLFIYNPWHHSETLQIMRILRRSLSDYYIRVSVYDEIRGIIETDHCVVNFFDTAEQLDLLKELELKADEIFGFPAGSWREYRKLSDANPWRGGIFGYIEKVERESTGFSVSQATDDVFIIRGEL